METENIAAFVILAATGFLIFFGARGRLFTKPAPKAKSGPSVITTAGTSGGTATATANPPAAPPPAPAPAATARNWGWLWWIPIILVAIFIGRWIWYETGVKSTYSPPRATAPKPQKLYTNIDPLSFNRQKSRGVRVENIDGGTTIVIEPRGELVYDMNIPRILEGSVFIEFHRRETKSQYVGYRINDIRHRHIFIAVTSGMSRYGTNSREFRTGENEIAFFSEGGRINIDGDKKIVVYEK